MEKLFQPSLANSPQLSAVAAVCPVPLLLSNELIVGA
jgi:hypothetical protein